MSIYFIELWDRNGHWFRGFVGLKGHIYTNRCENVEYDSKEKAYEAITQALKSRPLTDYTYQIMIETTKKSLLEIITDVCSPEI